MKRMYRRGHTLVHTSVHTHTNTLVLLYLKLSLDLVSVVLKGRGPLHRLVLGLQGALLLSQDLLVGLLQSLGHINGQSHLLCVSVCVC